MGSKASKQQAQTGTCGYWPYAGLGLDSYGFGGLSSPYGFGGFNGYNWFNGISPLAFPGFGGCGCGFSGQSLTHGSIKMKNTLTKATFNYKW